MKRNDLTHGSRKSGLASIALALLLSGAAAGQSLTMIVNNAGDDADLADENCVTSGENCTLRAAIQRANMYPGSYTIQVPAGTYVLKGVAKYTEDNNATGDLDIRGNVNIVGAGAGVTVISGGGVDRVFDIQPGATVSISGVTITGGYVWTSGPGGAGIRNAGNLTLQNSVVQKNGGDPTLSIYGGGIYSHTPTGAAPASVSLFATTVTGNSATHGGGVYTEAVLNLTDSLVIGNSAAELGGGIDDNTMSVTTVTRSTIAGNTATYGGGMNISGALTMSNCTLSGNTALHGRGGALQLASRSAQIGSCTLHGNTKGVMSGWEKNRAAIYLNSGAVSVRATILDESATDPSTGAVNNDVACKFNLGTLTSQGYNIDRGASCRLGYTGDRSNIDPQLDPALANNGGLTPTHALFAGSPAIDAIPDYVLLYNAGFLPSTDQRGIPRPQYRPNTVISPSSWVVDIGAFEYVYPPTIL